MADLRDNIRHFATELRKVVRKLGMHMSNVHHSPISQSVYYQIDGRAPSGTWLDFNVRISDHELPHPSLRDYDIILTGDDATDHAIFDEFVDEVLTGEYV